MDMNTRVVKEPRGFIRVIQIVFAIFAFSTTSSFNGKTTFVVTCPQFNRTLDYPFEYPFKLENTEVRIETNCSNRQYQINQRFPMDFSSNARFYVITGILAMLYCFGSLSFYVFSSKYYETNPLIPVIDLVGTSIITLFWFAGSCAWAAGVSDLRHYTHPSFLFKHLVICKPGTALCETSSQANWSSLNVSLIFGFTSVFLWAANIWFVYKETQFHPKRPAVPEPVMVGGYGEPIGQKPDYQNAPDGAWY